MTLIIYNIIIITIITITPFLISKWAFEMRKSIITKK